MAELFGVVSMEDPPPLACLLLPTGVDCAVGYEFMVGEVISNDISAFWKKIIFLKMLSMAHLSLFCKFDLTFGFMKRI